MAYLWWALEFLLEGLAAYLAFRKSKPLSVYLFFRAIADIATFAILLTSGTHVYSIASWLALAGQYILLCWLCCSLVASMIGERRYGAYAAILAVLLASGVTFVSSQGETIADILLDGGTAADSFLGLALLLGLMSKKVNLSRQLTLTAWGVCIHLGWDGLLVGIAHWWLGALAWLPLGAIAALGVWVWAGWKQQLLEAVPLGEARTSLPPRMPNRTLWLDESSRMVN